MKKWSVGKEWALRTPPIRLRTTDVIGLFLCCMQSFQRQFANIYHCQITLYHVRASKVAQTSFLELCGAHESVAGTARWCEGSCAAQSTPICP